MRWMWVDRILSLEKGRRLVAVKNVSLAEEHLHDHFAADADGGRAALPVMPASLIIEGMAQSAGILVGHANDFREKVVLAKVNKAELLSDAMPGQTLRYTAEVERLDATGAATTGRVELISWDAGVVPPPGSGAGTGISMTVEEIGRIDMMFAHVDHNMAGLAFPEHNFVFGETFKTLLRMSGVG